MRNQSLLTAAGTMTRALIWASGYSGGWGGDCVTALSLKPETEDKDLV